jgi:ATP adenylyltransferase
MAKVLWAPWRGEWIEDQKKRAAAKTKGVSKKKKFEPFTELPKQGANEKNLVLFVNQDFFVVLNRFPYNPGHMMVIPRQKVDSPEKLSARELASITIGLTICVKILRKAYKAQGFNIGMNIGQSAGAGIPDHIHWHIVPRWNGDTNFMPLLAEAKAVPSHNLTIYRKLKPLFATFPAELRKVMMV